MAYNETRVTVCGNVASKITRHEVGTGFSRVNFRMFTTERRWDQEQRTWVDGNRMFLSVNCWRSLADNTYASLNRGDPVVVTGKVSIKELREEGQVRQLMEIEATAIGPNLALCTARPVRARPAPHEALAGTPTGTPSGTPPPPTSAEALPVMTGAATPPAVPAPVPDPDSDPGSGSDPVGSTGAGSTPVGSTPAGSTPAGPAAAGPAAADPTPAQPAPTGRKRPASTRTGPKRAPRTPEPASPPAPEPAAAPAPDLFSAEVVPPRREGEPALVRPGEAGRPKEVAEVPF